VLNVLRSPHNDEQTSVTFALRLGSETIAVFIFYNLFLLYYNDNLFSKQFKDELLKVLLAHSATVEYNV